MPMLKRRMLRLKHFTFALVTIAELVLVELHTVCIQYEVYYINILAIMCIKPEEADNVHVWNFLS